MEIVATFLSLRSLYSRIILLIWAWNGDPFGTSSLMFHAMKTCTHYCRLWIRFLSLITVTLKRFRCVYCCCCCLFRDRFHTYTRSCLILFCYSLASRSSSREKWKWVCSNKPVNVSGANHKQNESKSLELTRNNNKKRTWLQNKPWFNAFAAVLLPARKKFFVH